MNIKNCGCCNDRKHRDIKGSDIYVTLDISLKFDTLENMEITSSDPKDSFGRSGEGLITSLGINASRSKYVQKFKVCHQRCHYEGTFKY